MRVVRDLKKSLRAWLGPDSPPVEFVALTAEELFVEGLFHEDWYRQTYADVSPDEDALVHFVAVGDAERRSPSPAFDSTWYAAQLPPDLEGAPGPVAHYVRRGRSQGRRPAPPETVTPSDEAPADAAIDVVEDAGGDAPFEWVALSAYDVYFSGLFDADWYRAHNPDLAEDVDALDHLLTVGDAERRSPSPLFDSAWYADQEETLDGAPGPLAHYLRRGREAGRSPVPESRLRDLLRGSPLYDERWYLSAHPDARASRWQPFSHFLVEGVRFNHDPDPTFTGRWYVEQYGDVAQLGLNPVEHYLTIGAFQGYRPNRIFDPKAYLAENPDVARLGLEPLRHYLDHGRKEGRRSGADFDEAFYTADNPDVDFGLLAPMAHYVRVGWRQGRLALPPGGRRRPVPSRLVGFSVLIDERSGAREGLLKTIASLRGQEISEWEALIAVQGATPLDIPSADDEETAGTVRLIDVADQSRSVRLRALLDEAQYDYVMVLDAGDELTDRALRSLIRELRYEDLDVLYSDDDQPASDFRPGSINLKPDWSPELLTAYNYFGRLTAIKRRAALAVDAFPKAAGEAAEWDLALKLARGGGRIRRLAEVLCHRTPSSDLDRPSPVSRRSPDHREVLRQYWKTLGIEATIDQGAEGTFEATWDIRDPPLVSIIIPNRNKPDLIKRVLAGLSTTTNYPNFELIIVDNASDDPETVRVMIELKENGRARVVAFNRPFNYSAACNAGAAVAAGELLLFLNNDVEMIDPDWLSELVRFGMRPGVGVVGTQLLYPDGTLQHAGVAVGMHLCGLVFRGAALDHWGVFGSPSVARNWLAIMGACQLVRREVFDRVGGFDESYRLANSDVALCVRAWLAGYRTAYAPKGRLIHHEGATRGRSNPSEDIVRTAQDFRMLGLMEDPYFHPALNAALSVPTLLGGPGDLDGRANLAFETERLMRLRPQCRPIDPYDVGAVAEAAGLAADAITWLPQSGGAVDDVMSAARLIIELLRTRADLRQRYPAAISGGRGGGLRDWMVGEGRAQLGLTDEAVAWIDAAFDGALGRRPLQVHQLTPELAATAPLGLTPAGRRDLLAWLFRQGVEIHRLRLEEIWWFALEWAETPARGVVTGWLFNVEWQKFHPAGLTPFGRDAFAAWLSISFGAGGPWMDPKTWPVPLSPATQLRLAYFGNDFWRRRHPRAFDDAAATSAFLDWVQAQPFGEGEALAEWNRAELERELREDGVNMLAHLAYPSGLKTSADSVAQGLERNGWRVGRRDVAVSIESDEPTHARFDQPEVYDISLVHVQPEPFFASAFQRADVAPRTAKTYRIAYWYWELDEVPNAWIGHADGVDELWAATRFVGDALRKRFDLPVHDLFPGVQLGDFKHYDRTHFGLEPGFTFLFVFHMTSIMERKNPLGLIRAFRQAFGARDDVTLVLKTSFGSSHPKQMQALVEAAAGANVRIIDAVYSRDETLSLMEIADAYVSLHRSEGFGLTMAESMLLGKPVVATAYSGNLDFMTSENALLVDYRLTRAKEAAPPYALGSTWAEPSIDHAAQCMRRLFDNPTFGRELGERGRRTLEPLASLERSGGRMADRLTEIQDGIRARRRAAEKRCVV